MTQPDRAAAESVAKTDYIEYAGEPPHGTAFLQLGAAEGTIDVGDLPLVPAQCGHRATRWGRESARRATTCGCRSRI